MNARLKGFDCARESKRRPQIINFALKTVKIAKRFSCANKQGREYFGKFEYTYDWVKNNPPTFQSALALDPLRNSSSQSPRECKENMEDIHTEVRVKG